MAQLQQQNQLRIRHSHAEAEDGDKGWEVKDDGLTLKMDELGGDDSDVETRLFFWLLAFRTLLSLATSRAAFAPDEHWQCLEVAHRIVFGYGYRTWEWRDDRSAAATWYDGSGPIRTVLYPAIFVPVYFVLKWASLDEVTWLLSLSPGFLQAVFAATADLYTFKLARKVFDDEETAWTTLLASLLSLYTLHTATRTLSNSLEATLTVVAIYHFLPPRHGASLSAASLRISLVLFALAAALRPSNVVLSLPLVLHRLVTLLLRGNQYQATFTLIFTALFSALLVSSLLFLADSLYYGRPTFTPIAFLRRNVLEGISLFYGASPFHFYLTSGLPFICFTTLPWTIWGLSQAWTDSSNDSRGSSGLALLARVTVFFIGAMSLLGHKEQRFLQPIVPLLHLFEGLSLRRDTSKEGEGPREAKRGNKRKDRLRNDNEGVTQHLLRSLANLRRHNPWAHAALLAHLIPAVYLFAHGSGTTRIMEHLSCRNEIKPAGDAAVLPEATSPRLGVLMPCHSTPWQSHLHAPLLDVSKSWFITCEPPLKGEDLATYEDESDVFYKDPYAFLIKDTPRMQSTTHLILFEALLDSDSRVKDYLTSSKTLDFEVQETFWNSLWHPDARRRGKVVLLRRKR